MNNIVYISMMLFFAISNLSCSMTYYTPPTTGSIATVSFSTLSVELPDIYIVSGCKSMLINNNLIERRSPNGLAVHKTAIPANEVISFMYVYDFIINERSVPIPTGNTFGSNIELKSTKYVTSCDSLVSFMPEKNKHYEIYFGLKGEKCEIKASESTQTVDSNKILMTIPGSDLKTCFN